ncbi:hypothetical protein SELMODRAFT_402258 [Selaginella moellendorffii]|uniref:NAC domain-containing protein n=1 Tax=Selaginella moellendorffii TaxID=88036 RepID=D8QQ31_SELML|nr:hypothetical protein SELMODRAFT_402258 [Selaginella moellendorffii]
MSPHLVGYSVHSENLRAQNLLLRLREQGRNPVRDVSHEEAMILDTADDSYSLQAVVDGASSSYNHSPPPLPPSGFIHLSPVVCVLEPCAACSCACCCQCPWCWTEKAAPFQVQWVLEQQQCEELDCSELFLLSQCAAAAAAAMENFTDSSPPPIDAAAEDERAAFFYSFTDGCLASMDDAIVADECWNSLLDPRVLLEDEKQQWGKVAASTPPVNVRAQETKFQCGDGNCQEHARQENARIREFRAAFKRALRDNLVIDVDAATDVKCEVVDDDDDFTLPGLREYHPTMDPLQRSPEVAGGVESRNKRVRKTQSDDSFLVDALRRKKARTKLDFHIPEADVYAMHPALLLRNSPAGTRYFFSRTKYYFCRPARSRTTLEGWRWKQQGPSLPIKMNGEVVAYKTYLSFVPLKNNASWLEMLLEAAEGRRSRRWARYTMEEIVLKEDRAIELQMLKACLIPRPFRVLCRISSRQDP